MQKPLADGAPKPKPAIPKKEPVLKPKKDAAVVISPDEEVIHKSGIKTREASSKKPGKTLTAILTARSKVQARFYFHGHIKN